MFFGISGFLICNRLLSEERRHGDVSIRGFYIRRVFRILPVFLIYLLVIACIAPVQWEGWRAAMLLYRNYVPATVDWNTRHSLVSRSGGALLPDNAFSVRDGARASCYRFSEPGCAARGVVGHRFRAPSDSRARNAIPADYRMPALLMGCVAATILADYRKLLAQFPALKSPCPCSRLHLSPPKLRSSPYRFLLQAPLVPIMCSVQPPSGLSLLPGSPMAPSGNGRQTFLRPVRVATVLSYTRVHCTGHPAISFKYRCSDLCCRAELPLYRNSADRFRA